MKRMRAVLLIGCISSLICACGLGNKVDTTTVSFAKDGEVTEIIVEDFSQPYYDMEELKTDIQAEISQYNANAGAEDAVELGDVELTDENVICVEMNFKSSEDYKAFNEKELFWGTVADAYSAGYEFTSMRDAGQEGVVLSAKDVLEKGDMHIVILEEAQQVVVPGKIAYISDGISVIEDGRAVNLNEGQTAFILYQ
nr:hypothetical protein [Lachnospiraceae bacterium]